jgi:hypothetical protein
MKTSKSLQFGAVIIVWLALISVALTRPKGGIEAENACLDQYNNCYGNCKGKPDVCYSNCDTVYLHCLHGAGTITTEPSRKLKKHPVTGGTSATNKNAANSSNKSSPTPTATPKKSRH